ncbi:Isochorismatase hydrolase [Penicillium citrinum]|uniref:Isochorismatase hydrolase n=1 Tax=Penicillium citrinum TaxID=5077 RepID=A0A9W9N8E4_PENCI|nr:Isochorismatase hydrolase [Penicillium citrinum]KAJ5215170.1 Isochorismatase hydrolase [Penicillium citrinum]
MHVNAFSNLLVTILVGTQGMVEASDSAPWPCAGNQPANAIGNYYNQYWNYADEVFDLTRSDLMNVTEPITITDMLGSRKTAVIEPSRSALVIIDMQNYFLHPALAPDATAGRAIVNTTIKMVQLFRKAKMKTLWVNWGIDDGDLTTMPPSLLADFSNGTNQMSRSFGSDLGQSDGIEFGRLLWRGAWNSQSYGPLEPLRIAGEKAGTDLLFHKNRQSGLWGAQTPLGLWLQENRVTTLFLGGVNIDQCVWGTLLDGFYKGYDVFLVPDISATDSPDYASQMVYYNTDSRGFLANSSQIIEGIKCNRPLAVQDEFDNRKVCLTYQPNELQEV